MLHKYFFFFTKIGFFHCFCSRYNLQEACLWLSSIGNYRVDVFQGYIFCTIKGSGFVIKKENSLFLANFGTIKDVERAVSRPA